MAETKGSRKPGERPQKGINLSTSIVGSKWFLFDFVVGIAGSCVTLFRRLYSLQEACATAPSSCAPTAAASPRGASATAGTTAATARTRGTATSTSA